MDRSGLLIYRTARVCLPRHEQIGRGPSGENQHDPETVLRDGQSQDTLCGLCQMMRSNMRAGHTRERVSYYRKASVWGA